MSNTYQLPTDNTVRTGFALPRVAYKLRCTDAKAEQSKNSGNNMYVLEFEVIDPETVKLPDGGIGMVQGLTIRHWVTLTEKCASMVRAFCKAFGVDASQGLPTDSVPPNVIGAEVRAILGTDVTSMISDVTKEEAAQGIKGEPILDSDGNPVKQFRHKVVQFI